MTKQDVCIVIPVYKESMSMNEEKSFMQCVNVLGSHDICLVAPEGLDTKAYMTARGGNFGPNPSKGASLKESVATTV